MNDSFSNLPVVARNFSALRDTPPEDAILQAMLNRSATVMPRPPEKLVAAIDSSDNLLLSIPDYPGAAVAGYSYTLVVSGCDGKLCFEQKRMADRFSDDTFEDLEIAVVYNIPLPKFQRRQYISDHQIRPFLYTPNTRSPYNLLEHMPEYKVRLAAARYRETTERKAVRTALFQSRVEFGLLLKDGRLSSQNVSPRYTEDIGRRAVERGVRYVGVVKKGTSLWAALYPYHAELFNRYLKSYWAWIPPEIIMRAYGSTQVEVKTLRLGGRESLCLGGIGGAWIVYGNRPDTFYILEFNVYDLARYHPLVERGSHWAGMPLEEFNYQTLGWSATYISNKDENGDYFGTQNQITQQDIDILVIPTVQEIDHLAHISQRSLGYPLPLADAHNRCKINRERKDRFNERLKVQLQEYGFKPRDFETWIDDPHKIIEN